MMYFDAQGNVIARLAGGGVPAFPNLRWLNFIRGPDWQLALQLPQDGGWLALVCFTAFEAVVRTYRQQSKEMITYLYF